MIWRYLRQFPKFVVAGLIIAASLTVLFVWRARRAANEDTTRVLPALVVDTKAQEDRVASKHERLILVDNDLYDVDDGTLLFRDWLKQGMPERLYYDAGSKTLIGQYVQGFVRFNLDGTVLATLALPGKPAISADFKYFLYLKDRDIWRGEIDWTAFKVEGERRITNIEQFIGNSLDENIVLSSEKTLAVRNGINVLRVNLDTGDVHPTNIPLENIYKRRTPDGKAMDGMLGTQFYSYDLDSDKTQVISVGKIGINDYQWLGTEKCAAIVSQRTVVLYDRLKNTLTKVAELPIPCFKVGQPSPDGRFVFCLGRGNGVLVDLEKMTATQVTGGAGVRWVSNDTFAFSREVADSELRGTWLQTVGEGERRASPEPYLVGNAGGFIMPVPNAGTVVLATQHGISKMKPDGSELTVLAALARPPERVLGIEEWKQ